jgi:energy-coupling factor transport system substrate-specific component
MKKWKLPGYSLFVLLCLALNYAGSTLSNAHSWPLWLDSAGTMFCAYLFGPVCGAIVGLTTNLLFYIASGDPWYYCAVSVGIAVVVGLAGKKRSLDTFFGTLSVCAMTAFVTLLISLPINLLLGNGSTGNLWGDAVIGFMKEQGIPTIPSVFIGQLYVELLDKLVILIILFLVMKLSRGLRSLTRRNQTEETEAGNGASSALALLLAAGLCA